MRVFIFFFIAYMFILMAQPCQDMAMAFGDCPKEETSITHVESPSDIGTEADLCSPFCICSCCSHPVSNTRFAIAVSVETAAVTATKEVADYENPTAQSFQNSIWQPPKA